MGKNIILASVKGNDGFMSFVLPNERLCAVNAARASLFVYDYSGQHPFSTI